MIHELRIEEDWKESGRNIIEILSRKFLEVIEEKTRQISFRISGV
jgi:hypothetical protein